MRPTADLGAYDLYLRAIQAVQLWTKSGLLQAIALLDKAIARAARLCIGPRLRGALSRDSQQWVER
jgi:hypothetical protein